VLLILFDHPLRTIDEQMAQPVPSAWVIQLGRSVWTQMWQVMMSRLAPPSDRGEYQRPASEFHDRVSNDVNATYPSARDRYRLYVGWSCPWAHRTLVVRALKGLESVISVVVLTADVNSGGWKLPEGEDGGYPLRELYQLAQPNYQGRSTVPVLWDTQTRSIVNNESAEIIEILNAAFNDDAERPDLDLYPPHLAAQIDEWNDRIYHTVNNGVYRCGFAQSQSAYDRAYEELFNTLNAIEEVLANRAYLCGDNITLADVRLFTTLIRFDLVYYSLFKCNHRRIQDYPYLRNYLRTIYHLPGVAPTCNLPAIIRDYYSNLFPLNPGGIIPKLPDLSYLSTDLLE
jgi:putative glutathione S-transferase